MNPFNDTSPFEAQFHALREVCVESNRRMLLEEPDSLFSEHSNVFIKSYLVSSCSILEAFLQNELLFFVYEMKEKVRLANIPHNLTIWSSGVKDGAAQRKFEGFSIGLTDKDVTEKVSGNIDKTILAFARVGVDVCADDEFNGAKDFVSARVSKRNSIIHDNDDASDISFNDVTEVIDRFHSYCLCIKRLTRSSQHFNLLDG